MAEIPNDLLPTADEDQFQKESPTGHFLEWVRTELVWYAGSFSFHLLSLSLLLLLPGFGNDQVRDDCPVLIGNADEDVDKNVSEKLEEIKIGEIEDKSFSDLRIDPTQQPLAFGALAADHAIETQVPEPWGRPAPLQKEMGPNSSSAFVLGPGPKLPGGSGIGPSGGNQGEGDGGFGFRHRNIRDSVRRNGTPPAQRAVNAALVWLALHQLSDGSWSLQNYTQRCADKTCTGVGDVSADAGATAMGLLPFLAADQTHKGKGPYREHVHRGIQWLIRQQQSDGNLAKGAQQMMYSHGLATIALCETYGLTADKDVGRAAQGAVNFILSAQNADGGWRYNPKDPGDTSVVGWQLMALKSAHMAGLAVGGSVFSDTGKWLDSVAVNGGAEYGYQPGMGSSPTMTSVGLLCRQYLGVNRDSPMLAGGMKYLLRYPPDEGLPNIYYWYYATQVVYNMGGSEWETWNRKIRDLLVRTQVRDVSQCANGSWPPANDPWGRRGGRVMQTSLSALTLEVYYRYLPLFKTEAQPR